MTRLTRVFAILLACFALAYGSPALASPVDDSAKAHAGDEAHDDHADQGVPLGFKGDLALWSLVTFGVFLFVLRKFAWMPMIQGLDTREAGMRQQAAETQQALDKANSLLKEHEAKLAATQDEVREIIAEAKRDAERTGQDLVAAARSEAEATRERAVEEIGRAKDVALKDLFDAMSGQVAGATEHVLGRAVTDGDQERLIDEALQQVAGS